MLAALDEAPVTQARPNLDLNEKIKIRDFEWAPRELGIAPSDQSMAMVVHRELSGDFYCTHHYKVVIKVLPEGVLSNEKLRELNVCVSTKRNVDFLSHARSSF